MSNILSGATSSAASSQASVLASAIFGSMGNKSERLANIALQELDKGLTNYTNKNYEGAAENFKKAVRLAPGSDTAINAHDYMARTQVKQGKPEEAIASYKNALKIDPKRDDLHALLGNIYTTEKRYDEAAASYALAVKNNPSAPNRYSLGQGYLAAGRLDEAKAQFEMVKQLSPKDGFGSFGIGQVYAKQERYDFAIQAFQDAINAKDDYWEAYSEMGYALVDSGDKSGAVDVVEGLLKNDEVLGKNLQQYIYEKSNPKMVATYASEIYGNFSTKLGPGTQVAGLNSYLTTAGAGAQQTFSMVFQFSKPMDQRSIENVFNWSIERASGTGRGDGYNYDMQVNDSEVAIERLPLGVYYDEKEMTATVLFNIRQNDTATGTIDPSHINFSFSGKDVAGMSMDRSADTYSGFSGFV